MTASPAATAEVLSPGSPHPVKPVSMRIPDASRYTGLGRSSLYDLMNRGLVRYSKVGTARLLLVADLDKIATEGVPA